MRKYLIFIITVLPFLTFAQILNPKLDWYRIYDGEGNGVDLTNDIKMDELNNIYVGGRSVGLDGTDLLILRYSESGDSLLEIIYNSAPQSWDEAYSMAIDSGLNIYVVGSATFEQNTFYAILHKYNSTGELIWAKDFYDDININSEGLQVTLNSREEPIIGYIQDAAKIGKYSSSGDSLWTIKIDDDTSMFKINYLTTDDSDNIYAAMQQMYSVGGEIYAKAVIIKINDAGEVLWEESFDNFGGKKVIFDNEGNPIFLAEDSRIIKFNPEGDTLWTREYPYIGDIIITMDLIVDSDNNILFTGYGIGDESWDYFTYKLSSDGEELWMRKFNSDEKLKDYASSIALDKEDNVYITGSSHNSISVGFCYTIKYSADGELKWKYKFDAPHSKFENGNGIFVDDSNNVYVGGEVADSTNGWNFLAFKIRQDYSTGITESDNPPEAFSLSQNYPNPFNPSTVISYQLPVVSKVTLIVYDLLGREIAVLVNEEKQPGVYEIEFDASNFSSGIYLYRIKAGSFMETRKMILLR
jgi:outer membrane protein assembly factor BamB